MSNQWLTHVKYFFTGLGLYTALFGAVALAWVLLSRVSVIVGAWLFDRFGPQYEMVALAVALVFSLIVAQSSEIHRAGRDCYKRGGQ